MINLETDKSMLQLKDVSLVKGLSADELKDIRSRLKEKVISKGELFFSAGDECNRILIVRSGRIKIFRTSSSGKEQILEILEAGDTCACHPGATTWRCSASAQALTTSHVWILDRKHYVEIVNSNHKLAYQLSQIFCKRLCNLNALIEDLSLKDPQKRLAKFLLDMSGNNSDSGQKSIPFTHDEISLRLGLVRETVTRHLNRLKQQGLIDLKSQKIIIKDPKGLEKLLD